MFNRGRFNHIRYNLLTSEEVDIFVQLKSHAVLSAMVASGGNTYETLYSNAVLRGKYQLAAATMAQIVAPSVLHSTSVGAANAYLRGRSDAVLESRSDIASIAYPTLRSEAVLHSDDWISVNTADRIAMASSLMGTAFLSVNTYEYGLISVATLLGQATTLSFLYEELVIDLSIPPGGRLVIDSDDYYVMLNNTNVFYAHSGDWLWLDRTVYDVQVMPLSGKMTADKRIQYTVRWL